MTPNQKSLLEEVHGFKNINTGTLVEWCARFVQAQTDDHRRTIHALLRTKDPEKLRKFLRGMQSIQKKLRHAMEQLGMQDDEISRSVDHELVAISKDHIDPVEKEEAHSAPAGADIETVKHISAVYMRIIASAKLIPTRVAQNVTTTEDDDGKSVLDDDAKSDPTASSTVVNTSDPTAPMSEDEVLEVLGTYEPPAPPPVVETDGDTVLSDEPPVDTESPTIIASEDPTPSEAAAKMLKKRFNA